MDGVIIDSEPLHYEVNQEIFRELDINISDEEYNTFIGVSNPEMWTEIKKKYNINKSVEELTKIQKNKNIEYLKQSNINPIPGVVNLLHKSVENNISTALASSSPMELIRLVLHKFAIKNYFDKIETGENVSEGKPAPDIFIKVANYLKIEPENIAVIEDSFNGIMAANKAGMKCVGYINQNSGNQDLSQADLVVTNLKNININRIKELF